jgi:signal transduction histidine kinase
LNIALQFLADTVVQASHATACLVGLSIETNATYRFVGSSGLPGQFGPTLEDAIRSGGANWITNAVRDRRLKLTRDLRRTILDDRELRGLHELVRTVNWDSAACLPLIYRDRILGVLIGFYQSGSELNSEEARFFGVVGNQAAAAIETARLFLEAQGKAALEERQRLARELHDSVFQVFYGIGIGATAIRDWLKVDPEQAIEPTDYVLSLVDAGIAEMRSLIFELRPESLAQEGLVAAIIKQANVLRARNGLDIKVRLGEEPDAPLDVKEALFRVGQEAMNNAAKHARASHADVRLEAANGHMALEVTDDGIGFDTTVRYPGHLGLQSMRERVERLNGTINLKSAPGAGTRVRVELPISHEDAIGTSPP